MARRPPYFGYGSNLDGEDLAAWCVARGRRAVRLEPLGRGFLPDRRLAFTQNSSSRGGGVLDVPEAMGSAVAGMLFRVGSDDDLRTLDSKEGEGHAYRRIETVALTEDGGEIRVLAYEALPHRREPFVAPAPSYLDIVRRGYECHGVAKEPLELAARGGTHRGPVTRLFVYGTLLEGEERHAVLMRHRALRGRAATAMGTLYDLGAYPGLVLGDIAAPVTGEIYEVPDAEALFAELDEIETFRGFGAAGSLYRRAIVVAHPVGSTSALAWTYVYVGARTGCHEIVSGDWRAHRQP
jgi:gamma-glutamylcyclotransferase (GGCT)/AIG2-like uncharacterized protein YtfP